MKALLAVSASRDFNETEFMEQKGTWLFPQGWQFKMGIFRQFSAQERHNVALTEAKYNYDRILFMDTDQVYPYDYLEKMLAHTEPVVSGLTVSRYHPYEITTYSIDGEERVDGAVIPRFKAITPPTDKKIFTCDMTGTGALMVDSKILNNLPTPYCKDILDSDGCMRLLPDDFYFGWQLFKAGIKVTVDQSIIVKHLAKLMVTPFNAPDLRRAWEKVNSGHGMWKDGKRA